MNNLFREGLDNLAFLGDFHIRQRGRIDQPLEALPCTELSSSWWENNILSYAKPEEMSKLLLFHAHHETIDSNIISALQKKSDTKVISSIREPLLIINTLIWINYSLNGIHISEESIEDRAKRANYVAGLMEDILSVPEENIYLFPTDLIQAQSATNRLAQVEGLMNYCKLPTTKKIRELTLNWNLVGDTSKTKRLQQKNRGNEFTKFKQIIQLNNKENINKILNIELSCLETHSILRDNLRDIGYNICW